MTVYFFLYQRFPNFKDEFSANILFAATFIFIYFHFTYFLHIELRWGENCDWTKSIWLALIGQIPPGGQKLQISTCGCAGRQQQNLKIVSRYVGNSKHFYTQSSLIHCFLEVKKNKQRSRVSSIRTMDINSRNLGQQEEDLDKKKFRKRASMSRPII